MMTWQHAGGTTEMAMATKATKDGTAGDKAPHLPRNTLLPLLLFTKAVNEEIHDRRMYYMCVLWAIKENKYAIKRTRWYSTHALVGYCAAGIFLIARTSSIRC